LLHLFGSSILLYLTDDARSNKNQVDTFVYLLLALPLRLDFRCAFNTFADIDSKDYVRKWLHTVENHICAKPNHKIPLNDLDDPYLQHLVVLVFTLAIAHAVK